MDRGDMETVKGVDLSIQRQGCAPSRGEGGTDTGVVLTVKRQEGVQYRGGVRVCLRAAGGGGEKLKKTTNGERWAIY